MMSYSAIIARVNTRPHPNADRLLIGNVLGNQVIVGKETIDGELGIYFESDGQLSAEFCAANNLIRIKNEDGTYSGGMFDSNRRVRAMNLRGIKSHGFWCPLSYLDFIMSTNKVQTFVEGYTFTEFEGVPICNKYVTEQTARAIANRAANVKRESPVIDFPEHIDTAQYRYAKSSIVPGSLIVISEKVHGTSGRYGNVLYKRTLSWLEKIAKRFGVKVQETEYRHVNGTRRVIMGDAHAGYYGNEEFRYNATKGIALKEGEILYFELVGFTTDGKPIMSDQATDKTPDVKKRYGPVMRYAYGCGPRECRMLVYRITQNGVDLSWFQVVKRCQELGLDHVPVLTVTYYLTDDMIWLDGIVNSVVDGASTLDSTHIREGVIIRAESPDGILVMKEKSIDFKILEGILKDDPRSEPDREETA
jgi:RNA ligase